MTSRTEEGSRKYPDIQGPTNVPWHLYHVHSGCFSEWALSHDDLDDVKIFRESVLQLSKGKIAE